MRLRKNKHGIRVFETKKKRKAVRVTENSVIVPRTPNLSFAELYEKQHGECFYCSKILPKRKLTRDHFFPKTFGNSIHGNMVLACYPCNQEKGSQIPTKQLLNRFLRLYGVLS